MIPAEFAPVAGHIWQSTLFAAVAVLLTFVLRRNHARVRYVILLIASYKFLIPFSWLVSLGREFEWRTAPAALPHAVSTVTGVIGAPAFLMPTVTAKPVPDHLAALPLIIWAVWGCGSLAIVAGWAREWFRIRAMVRAATPLPFALPIPVVSVPSRMEPGVFGIFRPVLLLPERVAEKLSPAQMRVVLAHELCHVRWRDNLASAMHMLVEALFWFHPLVWWLDRQIVEERERACDEEVVRMGGEPAVYVETILAICKSYVESPVPCMSGISGSDLKRRVVNVMANRRIANLSPVKKVLISALGIVAVAGPVMFGIVNAPLLLAQSAQQSSETRTALTDEIAPPTFEVASIKKHLPDPSGRMFVSIGSPVGDVSRWAATNVTTRILIDIAYGLKDFQLKGEPSWTDSERFDVDAKVDDAMVPKMQKLTEEQQRKQMALMLRPLLADRFKLQVSHSQKDVPAFALVVAKGGSKLKGAPPTDPKINTGYSVRADPSGTVVKMDGKPISVLTGLLSGMLRRPVLDQTGLTGTYAFTLQFSESDSPPENGPPSIYTALEEQLGLRLDNTKAPVDIVTVDHIEEPTPN